VSIFPLGKVVAALGKTQHTSESTAISDSSAGSMSRQDQGQRP